MTDATGQKPTLAADTPSPNLPTVQRAPLISGARIAAVVPSDIEQAFRLSTAIAASGMAPKTYLKNPKNESEGYSPEKIMIGILHGMEVGFTPMVALQSIVPINNMPTIWGDGALGLVRASGLLADIEEHLEGDGQGMVAVCTIVRRDQRTPIVRTFSWQDAKSAGLTSKQGPWQQYTKRMLQMRARSWALRDGFADVLRGLGIAEEIRDMGTLEAEADGSYTAAPTRGDFKDKQPPGGDVVQQEQPQEPAEDKTPEEIAEVGATKPAAEFSLFDPRSGEVTMHTGQGWIAAANKLMAVCSEPFDLWTAENVEAYQTVCKSAMVIGNKRAIAELDALGAKLEKLKVL